MASKRTIFNYFTKEQNNQNNSQKNGLENQNIIKLEKSSLKNNISKSPKKSPFSPFKAPRAYKQPKITKSPLKSEKELEKIIKMEKLTKISKNDNKILINDKKILKSSRNDKINQKRQKSPSKYEKMPQKIQKLQKLEKNRKNENETNNNFIKEENKIVFSKKSEKNFMEADWFKNLTDLDGNPKTSQKFDPTRVKIPKSALKNFTPSTKRYFELKSQYWDCIVFFKVGKFYEIFDEDALICHREIGLNFMRGDERPHVGIPEKVYEKYVAILVEKGYKIAKIDQVETVEEMKERVKKEKGPKIVKRDITSVVTPGANFDLDINQSPNSVYLLSIAEKTENKDKIQFGICFCNSATSEITFGSFDDDFGRTKLRSLISRLEPGETVELTKSFEAKTISVLDQSLTNALRNKFQNKNLDKRFIFESINEYYQSNWPINLKKCEENDLTFISFGMLLNYFKLLLIDKEIMSMRKFKIYNAFNSNFMALGSSTLENLNIFKTDFESIKTLSNAETKKNTLFGWLDYTKTGSGKRRLRNWTEAPLKNVKQINDRLDAVENLIEIIDVVEKAQFLLKQTSDIERILGRLEAFVVNERKAVMYENIDYRYIKLLKEMVDGFEIYSKAMILFKNVENKITSNSLKKIIESFPFDINSKIEKSIKSLNLKLSIEEKKAIFAEKYSNFQKIENKIENLEKEIEKILQKWKNIFQSTNKNLKIHKNGPETITIEAENSLINDYLTTHKKLPLTLIETTRTSKKTRFLTENLINLANDQKRIFDEKIALEKSLLKETLIKFCCEKEILQSAISIVAELDCLMSLAVASAFSPSSMCRPEVVDNDEPFLELRNSWNPLVVINSELCGSTEFVPNDIILGEMDKSQSPKFAMVTGPNMGGKSTLLRQVCLTVILAQIGCFVPASSARFSVVDQIFTRIGANDAILENKSTFFVELEETAAVLKNATKNSLVVLDELGRGTSTFDGTAIAFAVSDYLVKNIKCRTLFSTHYHALSDYFDKKQSYNKSQTYRMDYIIDDSKVIFLYKFVKGNCKESHGLNCAKLAGFNEKTILRANQKISEFKSKNSFKKIKFV